jgi:ABC-2 type transport system ATP-binding protein
LAAAIEFEDLRVSYRTRRGRTGMRRVTALAGLDLSVPEGGVFGFLGANGAGKTTAIRAAVGLLRGARGRVRMLGADIPRDLSSTIDRVGALVEQPSFFPNFTGRRNLELLGRTRGIGPNRVDAMLDRVGLGARADTRFATYSLGMKQRLGIAAALLSDPKLLLLDEPSNGLDPAGIVAMRETLKRLAATGKTVFVSSHILGEVQQLADVLGIIANGRLVREGPIEHLLEGAGVIRVRVARAEASTARAILDALVPGIASTADGDDGWLSLTISSDRAAEVNRALATAGIYASGLETGNDLESLFLELTGGSDAVSHEGTFFGVAGGSAPPPGGSAPAAGGGR